MDERLAGSILVTAEMEPRDMVELHALTLRHSRAISLASGGFLVALMGGIVALEVASGRSPGVGAPVMLLAGVALLAHGVLLPRVSGRKEWRVVERRGAVALTFTFTEDGLRLWTLREEGRYEWSFFDRVTETRRLFVLFMTPAHALLVPKRSLAPDDETRIRALLRRQVARFHPARP